MPVIPFGTALGGSVRNNLGYTPSDTDGLPIVRASEEVTVRVSFLDFSGQLQYSITRTTMPLASLRGMTGARRALGTYYESLGGKLLTVEIRTERSSVAHGIRMRPVLHLVRRGDSL